MELYQLQIEIYEKQDTFFYSRVLTNYDKAVEEGKYYLEKHLETSRLILEQTDYSFEVTHIKDLNYAENFDVILSPVEEYLKQNIEPTHITYNLDYKGNVLNTKIEFNIKQRKTLSYINMLPCDFKEDAGTHFKIGDIVTVINDENSIFNYDSNITDGKVFIVRYLPRRVEGQPYFRNTYALSSICNEENLKGIFTWEFHEKDIKKYTATVDKNSSIDILQRIIKGDVKVSNQEWQDLKNGVISFREGKNPNYKDIYEIQEGDNW